MSAPARPATVPTTATDDPAANRGAPVAPRALGTLFGDAARLYAQNWRTFLPAVLALELPLVGLKLLSAVLLDPGKAALDLGYIARAMPFLIILNGLDLVEAVVAFVLMALIARQMVDYYAGRTTAIGQALREVLPRMWDLFGGGALMIISVGLLTVVGVFLVSGLTLVFLVASSGEGGLAAALGKGLQEQSLNLWLNLILLIPILAAVIFLIVKWALMVQVVVLEAGRPWGALRRSWALVRGHFWRVLLAIGLGTLPLTLLQNGPTLLQTFTFESTPANRALVMGGIYLVTLLLRIGVLPWILVLVTLLYFDVRLRHGERLDLGPGTP